MFAPITWEDFLIATLVLMAAYYCIIGLLFFRKEILFVFQARGRKGIPSTTSTHDIVRHDGSIMGAIQKDTVDTKLRVSEVVASEITIDDSSNEPETIQTVRERTDDALLIGSVADLLHEIKILVLQMAERSSESEEVQSLIRVLLQRYPYLAQTTFQHAITVYICEEIKTHLHFQLTTIEVMSWWT
jgi:hypothetical protein